MSHDKKVYRIVSPATTGAMLFGAVVGGVASAAGNARKVKAGGMAPREAAMSALREAGTTGLAAGAGVAAMSALRLGGVVGLLGIAAVAAGAKYMLDNVLDEVLAKNKACRTAAEAAPAPETPSGMPTATTVLKAGAKPKAKPATKAAGQSAKARPTKAAPQSKTAAAE